MRLKRSDSKPARPSLLRPARDPSFKGSDHTPSGRSAAAWAKPDGPPTSAPLLCQGVLRVLMDAYDAILGLSRETLYVDS